MNAESSLFSEKLQRASQPATKPSSFSISFLSPISWSVGSIITRDVGSDSVEIIRKLVRMMHPADSTHKLSFVLKNGEVYQEPVSDQYGDGAALYSFRRNEVPLLRDMACVILIEGTDSLDGLKSSALVSVRGDRIAEMIKALRDKKTFNTADYGSIVFAMEGAVDDVPDILLTRHGFAEEQQVTNILWCDTTEVDTMADDDFLPDNIDQI